MTEQGWPELLEEEEELADSDEMLFRQAHPQWVQQGVPTSQLFKPTPKDEGKLSTARQSKIDAEGAYKHHVDELGLASAGTFGVNLNEVGGAGLRAVDDSCRVDMPNFHAYIDCRDRSRKDLETAAKLLTRQARERGLLFPEP